MNDCDSLAQVLANTRVVSLAGNVPGPVAAAALRDFGASVVKIEGPAGDLLAVAAPAWYAELHFGVTVLSHDLKTPVGAAALADLLLDADVLLTAQRLPSLARLGLAWPVLHAAYPRLVQVAIVGHAGTGEIKAGHDLTYVARAGLLDPPQMPQTLVADLAGAERAVTCALALLYHRANGHETGRTTIALADVAEALAAPLQHGLTTKTGLLGGSFGGYRTYRARDGWIAVAALETHFWRRLCAELSATELETIFATRDAAAWEQFGDERDIPIVAVRGR